MLCVHACVRARVRAWNAREEEGKQRKHCENTSSLSCVGCTWSCVQSTEFKVYFLCSGFVDGGGRLGDFTFLSTPPPFIPLFIFVISSFSLWIFEAGDLGFQCGLEMQKTKKKRAQRTCNNLTKAAHQ